jgi:predicted nucleic acid-binding protein
VRVVVDASVALKWLLADEAKEASTVQALQLLDGIRAGTVQPVQPAHWLIEVAAVLFRAAPEQAALALDLLDAMELPTVADTVLLKQASALAARLNHHLFDTLYHALAVRSDALLITADAQYYRKARSMGHILRLEDWPPA